VNLALDYDDTYTRDPEAWNDFISLMQQRGHNVYCVTMRASAEGRAVKEALDNKVDGIFFTARRAKRDFMNARGIQIDVWVDDSPAFVLMDAANAA
jgi:acid phosphatase class B